MNNIFLLAHDGEGNAAVETASSTASTGTSFSWLFILVAIMIIAALCLYGLVKILTKIEPPVIVKSDTVVESKTSKPALNKASKVKGKKS